MIKNKEKMKVYYHRTSTINQSGQMIDLDEKRKYCDEVIFDKGVSGTTDLFSRSGGKKLRDLIEDKKIKTLVVYKLDRLFRSLRNGVEVLDWLNENEVNVEVESMGISSRIDNQPNKVFDLIKVIILQVSEWERENILERTKLGREKKMREGVKFGRKEGSNETIMKFMNKPKSQQIMKYLKKEYGYDEIEKIVGCSSRTISKVKKHMFIYKEYERKNVSPNQLDLMVEINKIQKNERPKKEKEVSAVSTARGEEERKKPQPEKPSLTKEIKEMDVVDEEWIITPQMRENMDIMRLVSEKHNNKN